VTGQALGSILAGSLWGVLEHSGAGHAFLYVNLVLAGVAALAGFLIIGRGRVTSVMRRE